MTRPERLAEIAGRAAHIEATHPGPWTGDRYDGTVKYELLDANDETVIRGCNGNHDPAYGIVGDVDDFLMHAPEDLRFLLDTVAADDIEIARLRGLLKRCRPTIADAAETVHYGAPFEGVDPADFTPDPECCTADEIAAHKAAIEAGARPTANEVHHWGPTETDIHYTGRDGDAKVIPAGSLANHARTPWGIGTMTLRDDDMCALLADITKALENA